MCGIAGFIDPTLKNSDRAPLLESMLHAIAHRGPDARGKYFEDAVALGHNRLSIIDLSEDGNQPMIRNGNYIVYNGEVYNYREIRKTLEAEGVVFHTQSDTEVIMAAYEKYGKDCVQYFVGMWAFALWDSKQKLLFCSRDRFGIKPFFYILEGDKFYFGSEYKALFKSPCFKKEINESQVLRGLQLGWNTYHDETYYSCLKALPAAHNLIFKAGQQVDIHSYWNIDPSRQNRMNWEETKSQFRAGFIDSVRLHMRSDVEVGGCLSGGLDSSAIASVIGEEFPAAAFKTFTIYYEGKNDVDERPWVKEVLNKYPQFEPFYFTPTDDDIGNNFEKALYHADVPVVGSSPISQYFLMQLAAKNGIKVVLDGQGSDEIAGGYLHSFYRLIGGCFTSFQPLKGIAELNAHASLQNYSLSKKSNLLFKSMLAGWKSEQSLYELEYKHYYPFLAKQDSIPFALEKFGGSRLNNFLYHLTFNSSLPTLLQFEDRNSMAFSIESRVPFLDHRLVEFIFSLPDEAKIHKGATKRVLREALRGILPDPITDRKDKKGFVTPGEVKWLRGPLSFLLDQQFGDINFLNKAKVKSLIDAFKMGDNSNANLVWRVAVLRWWMGRGV